jgi:uncharacterized membrane protein
MRTTRTIPLIAAAAAGGTVVYLLDPEQGRRRRALVRDQVVRAQHKIADNADAASRDLLNRTIGTVSEARHMLEREEPSDEVLAERVRARMGRYVSHPSSIEVRSEDGRVTLTGPILTHEMDRLLRALSSVRGVKEIENRLEAHAEPGDVPGLQGAPGRRMEQAKPDILQRNWSPATRVVTGTAGAAMILWCMRQWSLPGFGVGLLGSALLARATTNMEIRRLVGIGAGRRAVDVHKTININAPVEQVFEIWSRYDNFPYFMSHVRDVARIGDDRSHWTVSGPAGIPVEWDAEVTRYDPPRVLEWRTLPGSTVEHAGVIHFDPNPDGSTRIDIHFSYNPIAGALGHLVAALFRADPRQQLHEDLVRLKSYMETGHVPHDAAKR